MQKILRNSVRCLKCQEQIVSSHAHDFVRCFCGNIAVDGGKEYLRRIGNALNDNSFEETSLYAETSRFCICEDNEPCDYHRATCTTCHPRCKGHPQS